MGQQLTPNAWQHLKKEFPEEIENLSCINFVTSRSNLAFLNRRSYRRKGGKKVKKSKMERYGHELGELSTWLDDHSEGQYYMDIDNKTRSNNKVTVRLYFFEETDAIAFKLVFGEKDLTFV